MDKERTNSGRRNLVRAFLAASAAAVMVGIAVLMVPFRPPTAYRFITVDHPINEMNDGSGRWFYYMTDPAKGAAPVLAAAVRSELLPLGFTEDLGNKPWFRFVKGAREVIVCNHDEIMTYATSATNATVHHESVLGTARAPKCPVLWVHEPGRDTAAVAAFKVKKLIMQW